jgi:hypothetical protein
MKIKSDFALLNVTVGRKALAKHFSKRPLVGRCPEPLRVPVSITGYIEGVWGHDDGISQEFTVVVKSLKTRKPKAQS